MSFIEKFKIQLSEMGENGEIYFDSNNFSLNVDLRNLKRVAILLKHELGFIQLVDLFALDNLNQENAVKRFEINFILYNFEEGIRLSLTTQLDESEIIPSVSSVWKNSFWCEDEIKKYFNLRFTDDRNSNSIHSLSTNCYDGPYLRRDYRPHLKNIDSDSIPPFKSNLYLSNKEMSERTIISVGPHWDNQNGAFRLWLEMEDEIICRSSIELGFIHRGIEKRCEELNLFQILPLIERLNYFSPSFNSVLLCRAVESGISLEIPDRAKAIRMILLEISRILDHARSTLAVIQRLQIEVGFFEFTEILKSGEKLLEKYSGKNLFHQMSTIGGVVKDLPRGWIGELMDWIRFVERQLYSGHHALISSPFWIEQNSIRNILASEAIEWGLSGPLLRSCGVSFDLRKSEPFYFYSDVDFEIPLGINGSSYDHYLVKSEEMRQSLNIIAQVADNLPVGEFILNDPRISMGERQKVVEGDKAMFARTQRVVTRGPTLNKFKNYTCLESANGELGISIHTDDAGRFERVRLRSPSMFHLQPYPDWILGMKLNDAKTFFESLNVSISEIDR